MVIVAFNLFDTVISDTLAEKGGSIIRLYRPCGNQEITELKFFVNKIESVVGIFTLVKFKESPAGCFIIPGFIGIADFHCREDMEQAFCFASLKNNLLDVVILTESMKFTYEFNFNPAFMGNLFRIVVGLLGKRLRETTIIKDANCLKFHIGSHSIGMTSVKRKTDYSAIPQTVLRQDC